MRIWIVLNLIITGIPSIPEVGDKSTPALSF